MEHWDKFLDCANGQVHLDVNADERTNLQLVITGAILHQLYHAGMIHLEYDQCEFILRGYHAELRQQTPTATYPENLGGVFYPWDFRKMISPQDGTVYELERRGEFLLFRTLHRLAGTDRHRKYHQTFHFDREFAIALADKEVLREL